MARKTVAFSVKHDTTVGDVMRELRGIPSQARVHVRHTPGDRPWESATDEIEVTWTEP